MMKSMRRNFWQGKNIVGVIGSGTTGAPELTKGLGKLIAKFECHLLTGGGGGIMCEVSKDFFDYEAREGLVIGIMRAAEPFDPNLDFRNRMYHPAQNPNDWVEIPIFTHLHQSSKDLASRNHINVLTSKVIVALPGGPGTRSEVELALEYRVPIIFHLGKDKIDGKSGRDFLGKQPFEYGKIAHDLGDVEQFLGEFLFDG